MEIHSLPPFSRKDSYISLHGQPYDKIFQISLSKSKSCIKTGGQLWILLYKIFV